MAYRMDLFVVVICRYVPPEQAKVIASVQASISGSSASSTSSTPEVLPQPLKTLHLTKTPSNQVTTHQDLLQPRICRSFFHFSH